MNLKNIFFIITSIIFFLGCKNAKLGDGITIKGYLKGLKKGDSVNYYMPIDGFTNFRIYNTTPVLNDSGLIVIETKMDSTGFIKIQTTNNRIYILASKGDNIEFIENQQSIKNISRMPVSFSGNNAEGLNLYNKMNHNLMEKFDYAETILRKKYQHGDNFYDSMIMGINKYLQPFDELYANKKITKQFFGIVKTDMTEAMCDHLLKNIRFIKDNNDWISTNTQAAIKMLIEKKLFETIINKDPYVLSINWGSIMINFIHEHDDLFKNDEYPITDSFFYKNGGLYKQSAHLSTHWNQFFWGDVLLVEAENRGNEFDFDTMYNYYKKKYPQSSYIKVLENFLQQQNNGLVKQSVFGFDSASIHIVDSTLKIKNLNELIKKYFKGKSVFIDLWATWCMPCKQEFKFKNQLQLLLKKAKVEMLYISIDDERFKKKWVSNIYQLGLSGYHINAGISLQKDISAKIFNDLSGRMNIPRYVLINKKGELVNIDMPRPSHFNELKKSLEESLSGTKNISWHL